MSRVGKQPITIPAKTKVDINGSQVTVTGPKGSLSMAAHGDMKLAMTDGQVSVTRPSDLKKHRALHGLTRALVQNMVTGVTTGYSKQLQIVGVGFRGELKGKTLILYIGYSHPVVFVPPDGIKISIEPKENRITVEGIDKELVGQSAAKIRSFRKPEPYQGKGIRYVNEVVRQKAGKAAAK